MKSSGLALPTYSYWSKVLGNGGQGSFNYSHEIIWVSLAHPTLSDERGLKPNYKPRPYLDKLPGDK
jgi:hypothetical protein